MRGVHVGAEVMLHQCLAGKVQDRHVTLSSARCSLTPKSMAEVAMEARRINMLTLLLAPKGFSFSAAGSTCTSGSCQTQGKQWSTTRRLCPFQGLCGLREPLSTACSSAKWTPLARVPTSPARPQTPPSTKHYCGTTHPVSPVASLGISILVIDGVRRFGPLLHLRHLDRR
jgi:hypothetical protein